MDTDPKIPPSGDGPQAGSVPPALQASEPPVIGAPPPPLAPDSIRKSDSMRNLVAILLSVCLGLFLADGAVSFVDESLIYLFDLHVLSFVRGIVFFFALLVSIVIYVLMGLTPMIPKRWFLPITLFAPVATMALIPCSIYSFGRIEQVTWGLSLCQVIVGLCILCWVRGGWDVRWPLVAEGQLGTRQFSWRNLCIFIGANVFVLVPAVMAYFAVCAALAVDHFSEGFMALRPRGLTVQVRKYARADGKTIQLFPMSHVADSDFYQKVSESFPANSIVLMEGVTDYKNLLTNKISYKRMAASLGLSEQHEKFVPSQGETVRADVDVDQFATNTIALLNLAMLVHSKGVNPETLLALVQYPEPPNFQVQLFDDLINKRNNHLLEEIRARLLQSENIIVPWGALHMPQIAREIQKSGFHLNETQEYVVIRFGSAGNGKPK